MTRSPALKSEHKNLWAWTRNSFMSRTDASQRSSYWDAASDIHAAAKATPNRAPSGELA